MSLTAQISNIKVSEDSSLVINNVYVGLLNTTSFSAQNLLAVNYYNFRVGAQATWQALSWLKVKSLAVYDSNAGTDMAMNLFSLKLHNKAESLGFEFGKIATPATESRPVPATADGQFETWAQSRLPGSALGAKGSIKIKNLTYGVGVNVRNDKPEYHVRISSKLLSLSSSYSVWNEEIQTSALLNAGSVYSLGVFDHSKNGNLFANLTNFPISQKNGIILYSDFGYQIDQGQIVRWELGLLKSFQVDFIKGLFCLGYVYEQKCFNAYLFVHI